MKLLVALPLLAGAAVLLQRPDEVLDQIPPHVLAGSSAFLLMPPQPIAGDRAMAISWSPTGDVLVLERAVSEDASAVRSLIAGSPFEPKRERSFIAYDVKAKKSTMLWSGQGTKTAAEGPIWLSGTNRFLLVVEEKLRTVDPAHPNISRESILLVDAATGASQSVMQIDQENGIPFAGIEANPVDGTAILSIRRSAGMMVTAPASSSLPAATAVPMVDEFHLLRSNGQVVGPLKVIERAGFVGWQAPNAAAVFVSGRRAPDGRFVRDYFTLDSSTAKVDPLTRYQEWQPAAQRVVLRAAIDPNEKPVRPRVGKASLASGLEDSQAEVAAEASTIALSPTNNAVAYISDGVALVRPLMQVPKKAFLQAVIEEERKKVMVDAKHAGLATLMYGADYDDVLPGKDFTMSDILGPYMKDPGALQNLVYTFQGGLLSEVKDPANTELGYISGPGGRAVIYVDGHVIWKPDK